MANLYVDAGALILKGLSRYAGGARAGLPRAGELVPIPEEELAQLERALSREGDPR